jgi:2-dehydro-3-deoxyphosphooctonate aldolase (KDO 8-P synthase)
MHARDVLMAVDKVRAAGNKLPVIVMDRGTNFGYGDLILDVRNFERMKRDDVITVVDGTHASLDGSIAPNLIFAGLAAGAQGMFAESHRSPEHALCDGACMVKLDDIVPLIIKALTIFELNKLSFQ